MLRIKDFKFKNKEELDFAVDPECDFHHLVLLEQYDEESYKIIE